MSRTGFWFLRFVLALVLIGVLVGGGALVFHAGQVQGYAQGLAASGKLPAPQGVAPQGSVPAAPVYPGYWPGYWGGYGWGGPHFFFPFGPLFGLFFFLIFFFLIGGLVRMLIFRRFFWGGPWQGGHWRGGPWEGERREGEGDKESSEPKQ